MSDIDVPHGLTCYCYGHCLDEVNGDHNINTTCKTKPGGYCFVASEEVYDQESNLLEIETTYGCFPPEEEGFMQCKGNLVPHEVPKSIACCKSGDLCNLNIKLNLLPTPQSSSTNYIFLTTCIVTSLLIIFIMAVLIYIKLIRRRHYQSRNKHLLEDGSTIDEKNSRLKDSNQSVYSNSGSGVTMLVQRTIAMQTNLTKLIGKGRLNEVWKGVYNDEDVAVKIFSRLDEASWLREQDIYQLPLINHPNILGFVAADVRIYDSSTQLLLITDYHSNGSLYDYLKSNTYDECGMLRLMYTAISGLCHLHMELIGKQIKPAIAHRDVNSKNILIKNGHVCMLADFGLAVTYDSVNKNLDMAANTRIGNIRYMPPELLNEEMCYDRIEAFKYADIYSMSLVLWEISQRCSINGKANDHQLPYSDIVPNEASFEEMRKIVCCDGTRPSFTDNNVQSKNMQVIVKMIRECWQPVPRARLSALRVKKNLAQLLESAVTNV